MPNTLFDPLIAASDTALLESHRLVAQVRRARGEIRAQLSHAYAAIHASRIFLRKYGPATPDSEMARAEARWRRLIELWDQETDKASAGFR